MADADARMRALEKELLKELEKVRSLKDETLKALALDFTKMGEVERILDSIKKATAVLGFKEDKPEKETTGNAQRMVNLIRANQSFLLEMQRNTEALVLDFEKFALEGEPPSKLEQLNAYLDKNDRTKVYAKTLLNFAEYNRGEAMYEYSKIVGRDDKEWKKTSAGSWANAILSINYFHICDQFYGLLFSNIR
jgi:hypothetical protein